MKKSAFISDVVFAFTACFLPMLCLLRYLRFPVPLALILSLLAGVIAAFFAFLVLNEKRKKTVTESKEAAERDNFLLYLTLLPDQKLHEFLLAFLQGEGTLYAKRLSGQKAYETEDKLYFPVFTLKPVDGDIAANIIRVHTDKQKIVLCPSVAPEAERLFSRFSVETLRADEMYKSAKAKELVPERYPFAETEEKKLERKLKIWFSKRNAKPFFTGAIFLFISSLLTPFSFYYLVFAFILLASSVLVRVIGK